MPVPARPEDATVAELAAIEKIRRLKARYFRCVDTKDWPALAALFTADATVFFPESQDAPVSAADGITFIAAALDVGVSVHHGHMAEIEILSETSARAVWAMEDRLYWDEGAIGALGLHALHGYGHYHEAYRKEDGVWLIESFRLSRLWSRGTLPPTSV